MWGLLSRKGVYVLFGDKSNTVLIDKRKAKAIPVTGRGGL
jgi:hypothetical protein